MTVHLTLTPPLRALPSQALIHQAVLYLFGMTTANTLRPFLRRRERTARPHFVSMRARKPCLRTRRVLRGRYVGLPMKYLVTWCEVKTKRHHTALEHVISTDA